MMDQAVDYAVVALKIPEAEAHSLASDAITHVWEACRFGRADADDEEAFWPLVVERLRDIRWSWRRNELSLDAPIPNTEGEIDGHETGWNGYRPPDQIEVTYLNEVKAGIELLPRQHSDVMRLIASGHNAVDVSRELNMPVHTVFRLLTESRRFLFDRELIRMAKDNRRDGTLRYPNAPTR